MKVTVYTQAGKEKGTVEVSDAVFSAKWNEALVSQVVRGMQANARTPVAHAKDRSEVRGGGRKPWKQKGTGRARHGSTRSPIWVGGGKAHGPVKMRDYSQKINKMMKAKALFATLSEKVREGKVAFVESLAFAAPKTKDAVSVLSALAKNKDYKDMADRRTNAVLIAVSGNVGNVEKSFRNMNNVEVISTASLNAVSVLKYKYVLITEPEVASTTLEKRIIKTK